jgi:hypothetical protein
MLHGIIKPALETEEFGYHVKRADEDATPGMISDRIISDILNAKLVVADLTELNPNTFYELGICHLAQKPAIHIARIDTHLPFDLAPHRAIPVNVLDYRSVEDAKSQLADAARIVNSAGYRVSNPVTHAVTISNLRISADPIDRAVADIQDRLTSLEAELRVRMTELPQNMQDNLRLFAASAGLPISSSQPIGPIGISPQISAGSFPVMSSSNLLYYQRPPSDPPPAPAFWAAYHDLLARHAFAKPDEGKPATPSDDPPKSGG